MSLDENAIELDASDDNREYKVETIWDSAVYTRESESGHLSSLYYLVPWKRYLKKENTWEPASAVQYLRKLMSLFHKDHSDKPITTFLAIDTTSPIARLIVIPIVKLNKPPKQKQRQSASNTNQ